LATRRRPNRRPTDYYIRQLRDWKYSVEIGGMNTATMTLYGRMCGWALARAHARTGDRVAIAAYLGQSDAFDRAVAEFAETYADQNERDHAALAEAVASGRVPAQLGI
jgi:NAD(P)-dependent dehydrogenase (short-subunit alcohol dehydrogenase family)